MYCLKIPEMPNCSTSMHLPSSGDMNRVTPMRSRRKRLRNAGSNSASPPATQSGKASPGGGPLPSKTLKLLANRRASTGRKEFCSPVGGIVVITNPEQQCIQAFSMVPKWRGQKDHYRREQLGITTDELVYDSSTTELGRKIIELGKLDQVMDTYIPNSSLHWIILFGAKEERFMKFLNKHATVGKLSAGLEHLNHCLKEFSAISETLPIRVSPREIQLGIKMTKFSLKRGISMLEGKSFSASNPQEMVEEFQDLWVQRARPGGLKEASGYLREALS